MNHEVAMMPISKCVNWASQRLGDKAEVIQMADNPSSAGPKVLSSFSCDLQFPQAWLIYMLQFAAYKVNFKS